MPSAPSSLPTLSTPSPPGQCPNDLGGVHRLLSALISPSAISQADDWRLTLHVSPSVHASLSSLLRHRRNEDVQELISLGEQLLHSATFSRISTAGESWATAATRDGQGPIGSFLDGVQQRAGEVVGAVHDGLFAPIGVSSDPAHTGLWLQALLLLCSAIIGSMLSSCFRSSPSPSTSSPPLHPSHGVPSLAASSAVSAPLSSSAQSRKERGRALVNREAASFASSLWVGLLLLLLVLFVAGYVHHYHALFIEQRARNRVLQSTPPPGCLDPSPPSLYTLLTSLSSTLTRARADDACWRWEASLHQSSYPNPLLVLSSFLSLTLLSPLAHAGDALGSFTRHFLAHHGVLMQVGMMAFLLLFLLGCVALCMLLGKACIMRVGLGMARGGRGRGRRRVGGGREEVLVEEASEEEEEEEEERERRVRRLLKGVRRREEMRRLLRLVASADDDDDDEQKDGRGRKEERQRNGQPLPLALPQKEEKEGEVEVKAAGRREKEVEGEERETVKQEPFLPPANGRFHSPVKAEAAAVSQPLPEVQVKAEHPVPEYSNG